MQLWSQSCYESSQFFFWHRTTITQRLMKLKRSVTITCVMGFGPVPIVVFHSGNSPSTYKNTLIIPSSHSEWWFDNHLSFPKDKAELLLKSVVVIDISNYTTWHNQIVELCNERWIRLGFLFGARLYFLPTNLAIHSSYTDKIEILTATPTTPALLDVIHETVSMFVWP